MDPIITITRASGSHAYTEGDALVIRSSGVRSGIYKVTKAVGNNSAECQRLTLVEWFLYCARGTVRNGMRRLRDAWEMRYECDPDDRYVI